jgi:hypothetical protein
MAGAISRGGGVVARFYWAEKWDGIPRRRRYGAVSDRHAAGRTTPTPEAVMTALFLLKYLGTALVAGVVGGLAMQLVMRLIGRGSEVKGDMILALGSLITKTRDNAYRVGLIVHVTAAVGFGLVYTLLMVTLGYTGLPMSLMLGLGVGTLHGLIVSLMLVWVVADQHPLEEFKEADLLVGLSHMAGHVAYGGMIGLLVGLSPL